MAKQLELADDGRVIIRTSAQEWVLRRPNLREFREIVELAEAADKQVTDALAAFVNPDGTPDIAAQINAVGALQVGTAETPPLFGALVRTYVSMLSDEEPMDVDDLPSWALTGAVSGRLISHWRSVPLDLGPGGGDQ